MEKIFEFVLLPLLAAGLGGLLIGLLLATYLLFDVLAADEGPRGYIWGRHGFLYMGAAFGWSQMNSRRFECTSD